MRVLGFTGTREKVTEAQRNWLDCLLGATMPLAKKTQYIVHHGACVGADALCHLLSLEAGHQIEVHPPHEPKHRMTLQQLFPDASLVGAEHVTVHEPRGYLERDRDIVHAAQFLVALPNGPQRKGSGTWYTIEYALKCSVPVAICYPDGELHFPRNNMARVI